MELNFDEALVLEVTRRCNMSCAHCLRGDAQNLDITYEIIDKALAPVCFINTIVFSGGEPALNVDAIRYTLNQCIERGIKVNSFYIVTNGKVVTPEFLQTCLDWYCFCVRNNPDMAKEYSGLSCSSDPWHEPIPEENRVLLETFAFSRPEEHVITRSHYIINEGRARSLTGVRKMELSSISPVISNIVETNLKIMNAG